MQTSTSIHSAPNSGSDSCVNAMIDRAATVTITTPRKTACSERRSGSEDVDADVDDDPHHVYEVPVDAGHLDAEVVLRRRAEVAAEGADRREGEQSEADEDVGAVQAGEAVEDRAEAEVAGAEADVDVLVELDEEEGGAQQPGEDEAQFEAGMVALADRLQRVVDREAGGDQDRGVDAGHGLGQLEALRRPARRVDDHAQEEVGGEEGAEQHHLRDDEEQDPQRLPVHP